MRRQNVKKVDSKFCLQWHLHEFNEGNQDQLYRKDVKFGDRNSGCDEASLAAMVHFMLLEHLELIDDGGNATVFGNSLKGIPQHLQEPCLVALEMLKFGLIDGQPFNAARADNPFPEQINYPKVPVDANTKSVLLLTRV